MTASRETKMTDRRYKVSGISKNNDINVDRVFDIFGEGFDRFDFPADVHRVTAGQGGESLLIIGSEKTALLDCGMAFCGRRLVENIRKELAKHGKKTLDYVLLTHSHYDHVGALPYVKEAFPHVTVCGSRRCSEILPRPNARKLIRELGLSARKLYEPESSEEIQVDNLAVDMVMEDGDSISLGKERIVAIETKGHTDCSMSYGLEPVKLLFTSESTGIAETEDYVDTPILKSYDDAMVSLKKCMDYGAQYICLPHCGMLPKDFNDKYWQMFDEACKDRLRFVKEQKAMGIGDDEMARNYVRKYWDPDLKQIQPAEAYEINSKAVIKAMLKAL